MFNRAWYHIWSGFENFEGETISQIRVWWREKQVQNKNDSLENTMNLLKSLFITSYITFAFVASIFAASEIFRTEAYLSGLVFC